MIFRTVVFLLLAALSVDVTAQAFRGGLKTGISASQVSGDALSGFNKAGIAGGAFVNRAVSEKLSWQLEMLYMPKGSRKATNPDKGDFTFFLLRLNYFEVPVILKYKKDKFTYEGGLAFGRLISWSVEDHSGTYPVLHPESRPFFKNELSANIGISYPLFNRFTMNWRASNSILPVRPHQGNAVFRFNRGQYNTVLQFTLNYQFEPKAKTEG